MSIELNGKRLDLLRSALPQIATIAALVNPANPANKLAFEQTEAAGRSLGLGSVRRIEAERAGDLPVLRPEVFSGADAALILPEGVFYNYRRDVVALINEARLPAIHPKREYADDAAWWLMGRTWPTISGEWRTMSIEF